VILASTTNVVFKYASLGAERCTLHKQIAEWQRDWYWFVRRNQKSKENFPRNAHWMAKCKL